MLPMYILIAVITDYPFPIPNIPAAGFKNVMRFALRIRLEQLVFLLLKILPIIRLTYFHFHLIHIPGLRHRKQITFPIEYEAVHQYVLMIVKQPAYSLLQVPFGYGGWFRHPTDCFLICTSAMHIPVPAH